MNHQIQERIRIISQLKSIYSFSNQALERRIRKLKVLGVLNYGLANFLLFIVIIFSAIELLSLDSSGGMWQKSAMLVMITFAHSLHAHFSYIDFLLLRHAKNLKNKDYPIHPNSDKQLKALIDHLNYHRFQPYWMIIPAAIIILASVLNYFDSNPYWKMFAWPTLVISALMLWRLNNHVFLIRNNIGSIESHVGINIINLK